MPTVVLNSPTGFERFVVEITMNGTFFLVETGSAPPYRLTIHRDEASEYCDWTDALEIAECFIYSPQLPDEVSGIRVARK